VCSGSFKGEARAAVLDTAVGKARLRKLFSKPQRAFFADHAPEGVELDDLSVLGPVHALKLKVSPKGMARRLAVEMWIYPDGTQIVELSTKCAPNEWLEVGIRSRDFLRDLGLDLTAEQATKTRTALEYFAALK
jgi:hypothetical protein